MRVLLLIVLAGCVAGGAPEVVGVGDQVAIVGQELRIDLEGTDPDGDRLTYAFRMQDLPDVADRASISVTPAGAGVFRWTPLASDLGEHAIDFTVSDGTNETVVTVTVSVVSSATSPVFRAPLGSGTTLDLDQHECLDLDVVVEDADTASVALAQGEPAIAGAVLDQTSAQAGVWHWCPSIEQRATSRYTLVLSADDGHGRPTLKDFVVLLRGGADTGPACTDDASEPDDDDAHARTTTYPSFSSTGNVICEGNDDRYAVPAFTGEIVTVNLTFTQHNPEEDLDLHLFEHGVDLTPCDPSAPELCSIAAGQSADSNEHAQYVVPAGCAPCDYDVVVRGFDGSSAPYAISIEIQ